MIVMPNQPSHKNKNKKAGSHNDSQIKQTSTPPKRAEFSEELNGKLNNNSGSNPNPQKNIKSSVPYGNEEFSKELTDIIKKNLNGPTKDKKKQ
jgi:hypothetical protein